MRNAMGLRIIVSVLLIVSIFLPPMSGALTTFGKTNPQNTNPPPSSTPVGRTRYCKVDNECAGIQNTSCLSNHQGGKLQCLCNDYTAPVNGACTNKHKALRSSCNNDGDCVDNAYCVQRNNTLGRRCYCQEGFYEITSMYCSGCSSIFTLYTTTLLIALVVLGRLNYI